MADSRMGGAEESTSGHRLRLAVPLGGAAAGGGAGGSGALWGSRAERKGTLMMGQQGHRLSKTGSSPLSVGGKMTKRQETGTPAFMLDSISVLGGSVCWESARTPAGSALCLGVPGSPACPRHAGPALGECARNTLQLFLWLLKISAARFLSGQMLGDGKGRGQGCG